MKLNFLNLTAFTRHTGTPGMNPRRDWNLLLIMAALLLVMIVAWHVWAFKTVVSGGSLDAAEQKGAPPTKASVLDTLPALLDARASEDANYVNGAYRFADPSQ